MNMRHGSHSERACGLGIGGDSIKFWACVPLTSMLSCPNARRVGFRFVLRLVLLHCATVQPAHTSLGSRFTKF